MSKIDLDHHPVQHRAIIKEMSQILEWWTGMKLRHTATFGARIYRGGNMLVNHVDRQAGHVGVVVLQLTRSLQDTHLASAVLQVSQDVPGESQGWPLEVFLNAITLAMTLSP